MNSSEPVATAVRGIPRRSFLGAAAAIGLSSSWSQLPDSVTEVGAEVAQEEDLFVLNLLGGLYNPNPQAGRYGGSGFDARSIADAIGSGMRAVNVTVSGFALGPQGSFDHTVTEVTRYAQRVGNLPEALMRVRNAADIDRAREERKVGIIFGFQNAAMMGDDASRVRTFADLGVRIIQLTYNGPNQLGHGALVPENGGLTPFGYEVVEALEAADVLADLSHSGQQTCLDALRGATRPTAITHTGCRALTDVPNNKTDEELRLVAETGGIVGIYFVPFFLVRDGQAVATDVVRHVEHALNVCGEDHVGIGTDAGTTQIDDMGAFLASPAREAERRRLQEVGGIVLQPGDVPVITELQGPDQFRRLAGMLMDRGHSVERVAKIMGKNALRVMREVWRA